MSRLHLQNYRHAASKDLIRHLEDFQDELDRPRRVIDALPRFGLLEQMVLTELLKRVCNEERKP